MAMKIFVMQNLPSPLSPLSPYCHLRRTFATRLLEHGTDINIVHQAMGHASVLTTQKYDKRDQSVVNEAMRNVDL